MKICTKCNRSLPLTSYPKSSALKDGRKSACKDCASIARSKYRAENLEKEKASEAIYKAAHKAETRIYSAKYYIENTAKILAYQANYYIANSDMLKAKTIKYHKTHLEEAAAYGYWHRREFKAKYNAWGRKRFANKLQATPTWADKEKILAFYTEAHRLTDETGIKHVVDHIVPLQNPDVCGFHCEDNLQVLTQHDNAVKSNKFTPGFQ